MKHTDEYLRHKVLNLKYGKTYSVEHFVGAATVDDGKGGKRPAKLEDVLPVKNVCAKLHVDLVERLDKNLNLLEMSKREFIEIAIVEALEKVEEMIDETNAIEHGAIEYAPEAQQ